MSPRRSAHAVARSPLTVIAVFLLTRAWAAGSATGATGYPAGPLVMNDVNLYGEWARLLQVGVFPHGDPMWQYPPLAGPLFVLGALLPPNPQAGFMALAFAVDAATMVALIVVARRRDRWGGAWLWAVAAAAVGPVFLTRFDVFPTALAVVALLIVERRPAWSGALLGLGAALKVWPVLALAAVARRRLPAAVAAFAAALAGVTLVVVAMYGGQSLAFLTGQSKRGLQLESVAALPFVIAHAAGAHVDTSFRYGSMEINAPGAGAAALIVTVIGAVALGGLGLARLTGRLESTPGADVAFVAVAVSVVVSRVFSPQYTIWLVGIGAACLAARVTVVRLPVLLVVAAAVVTQPVYPAMYAGLVYGHADSTTLHAIRIALVVVATGLAYWNVLRRRPRHARGARSSSGSRPSSRQSSRAETMDHVHADSIH